MGIMDEYFRAELLRLLASPEPYILRQAIEREAGGWSEADDEALERWMEGEEPK